MAINNFSLMLGDWVKRKEDGDFYQIRQLGICGTDRDGNDYPAVCIGKPNGVGLIMARSEVEPIPITPNLLYSNGFELKPDGWIWCKEKENEEQNYIFIQFRKGCEEVRLCEINFVGRVSAVLRSIHFVHELQQALRLFKIKKEISLSD